MYVRKRAVERIANEKVLYSRRGGGDLPVCVVYPNIYRLGMANLGFQAIFHIFDSAPRVAAERAFLPDPDERESYRNPANRLVSLEHGRSLADFEILAFSISFETDYLNVSDDSADGRDSAAPRRSRRTQLSADNRRWLRCLSQSRAHCRLYRPLPHRRGRGDGARISRSLQEYALVPTRSRCGRPGLPLSRAPTCPTISPPRSTAGAG